jgi:hypothetical protein
VGIVLWVLYCIDGIVSCSGAEQRPDCGILHDRCVIQNEGGFAVLLRTYLDLCETRLFQPFFG